MAKALREAGPNIINVGDYTGFPEMMDSQRNLMRFHASIGIWELFIPNLKAGQLLYKYEIRNTKNEIILKANLFAFSSQLRPKTASKISALPDYIPMTKNRKKANRLINPFPFMKFIWVYDGETYYGYMW